MIAHDIYEIVNHQYTTHGCSVADLLNKKEKYEPMIMRRGKENIERN